MGQTLGAVEYLVETLEGLFTTKVMRNILKSLVEDGFITIESNRNGNIVTIVDYKARHSFTPYKKDSESYIKKGKEWDKEKSSKTPKLSYKEQGEIWAKEKKDKAYADDMAKAGRSVKGEEEYLNRIKKHHKESLKRKKNDFIEELKPYVEEYGKDYIASFFKYWSAPEYPESEDSLMKMTCHYQWYTPRMLKEFDYKP